MQAPSSKWYYPGYKTHSTLQYKKKIIRQTCSNTSERKRATFHNFVDFNMKKFIDKGDMKRREGSGGQSISLGKARQIKRESMNKLWKGLRGVGTRTGVCKTTVQTYLKKFKAKPYHRRKVQGMKPAHLEKRVTFCQYALDQYGHVPHPTNVWGRLINTDFSGPIGKSSTLFINMINTFFAFDWSVVIHSPLLLVEMDTDSIYWPVIGQF